MTVPSLTVPGPYPDPTAAVIDQILLQTWYRQLGMVAVHYGIAKAHAAAEWLAANGRGGSVRWLVPGRVALWSGIQVTPGVAGSPLMNVYLLGAALTQWNTVVVRQGFWELYIEPPSPSS